MHHKQRSLRRIGSGLIGIGLVGALAGCATVGPGEDDSAPSSITIAVGIDVVGPMVDPADGKGAERDFFLDNVYRSILRFDKKGEIQPDIAASYDVSSDFLEYKLKLRDDVKFHNGETVTAEDVAFSIDRNRGILEGVPNATAAHYLKAVDEVTVEDKNSVVVRLSNPDPLFLQALAWKTGAVVPKAYLEEVGNEGFQSQPIGAGPYQFESQQIGQSLTLSRFDDYNGSDPGTIDTVEFKVVPERTSRVSQLQAGDVDFVFGLDPSQVDQVEGAGLSTVGTPSGQNMWLMIDKRFKEFESPEVRQALQYAINREGITEALYKGMAEPISSLDNSSVTSDPNLKPYPYDPDRAKELIAKSGETFDRPIPFAVAIGRYPMGEEASLAIQSDLEKVGINLAIERMEYGTWVDKLIDKSLSGMSFGDIPNTIFDPLRAQPPNMSCDGAYSMWCDEDLDRMNAEANSAKGEERVKLIREYDKQMHENPPGVFLWQTYSIAGMQEGIRWDPRPGIAHFVLADITRS